MSFYQISMFVCSDWSSQLISVLKSMFQTSPQHTCCFRHLSSTATHLALTVYRVLYNTCQVVHTFMTFHVDCCNVVFVWALKLPTDCNECWMQQLEWSVARGSSTVIFWAHQVQTLVMMCWCQDGTAPQYLIAHWAPVSETTSHQLTVSSHWRRVTWGHSLLLVHWCGTHCWNVCTTLLTVLLSLATKKAFFFSDCSYMQRIRGIVKDTLYKLTFYIMLHYIARYLPKSLLLTCPNSVCFRY